MVELKTLAGVIADSYPYEMILAALYHYHHRYYSECVYIAMRTVTMILAKAVS